MSITSGAKESQVTYEYVYSFGKGLPSPPLDRNLLGSKGVGLAEMASIGIPVPPGCIITTLACNEYCRRRNKLPEKIKKEIISAIAVLEKETGKYFGCEESPLMLSVRSGARVSIPGMMDTILNLGLNDKSVEGFAKNSKNERFAYDNYRRFISLFGEIVEGIDRGLFERAFDLLKHDEGAELDIDISVEGLKEICIQFKDIYESESGHPFPQDVHQQLFAAIGAVFESWCSERCTLFRKIHYVPEDWGTAVTVQVMVFGNKNNQSATGVGFTRDPATGENQFFGEFLLNAQGEEVVAGIRTPHPINMYQKKVSNSTLSSLEELLPETYLELTKVVAILENYYRDMQDIEFTIDDGKLYMLQTRSGKRTGFAAVRMAIEMLDEGLIDEKIALKRIEPNQLEQLLAPVFNRQEKNRSRKNLVAVGLNAGPGAASGRAAFSSEQAIEWKNAGIDSILIREESCPDDFLGLKSANGVLTTRGGATSHAAVVARGMGKPYVVGCHTLHINEKAKTLSTDHISIKEGDLISIDGMTGEVFFCALETSASEIIQVLITKELEPHNSPLYQQYERIMSIADKYRCLKVRTNADTPQDSIVARAFGAEGIGLCRTEHMFTNTTRLNDLRRFFFSCDPSERQKAMESLFSYQKEDFTKIFRAMDGVPVTIRLLDPPLHELMPHNEDEFETLGEMMRLSTYELRKICDALYEANPMLGHRGCRLGITYPEITEMQTRAIFEAAIEVSREGVTVIPEIMVPLVGIANELEHQRVVIETTAKKVFEEKGYSILFKIGTMIELPRAALTADQLAKYADFFSFGTNDLTQTTFGISRDEGSKFVPVYLQGVESPYEEKEDFQLLKSDPFQVLDQEGVGQLLKIAIEKGNQVNKSLYYGICGEHGGEPKSVAFCQKIGLDYVSCSPYRVAIAKFAAAIASIES